MKKIAVVCLCLVLSVTLLGCKNIRVFGFEIPMPDFSQWKLFDFGASKEEEKKTEKLALEYSEDFFEALQGGDLEALMENLPLEDLTSSLPIENEELLTGVMEKMSFEVQSMSQQEDGSVEVVVEVETVDLLGLVKKLPPTALFSGDLQNQLLDALDTAPLKSYETTFRLVKNENGQMEVEIDNDFTNAISGGMLDLFQDLAKNGLG